MDHRPTREEAWKILNDHVKTPNLIAHALAVEAVMRHVARKKGADEEMWGIIRLIHHHRGDENGRLGNRSEGEPVAGGDLRATVHSARQSEFGL